MDRTLPLDAHHGAADDVPRDAAEAYGAQDDPAAGRPDQADVADEQPQGECSRGAGVRGPA